MAKGKGKKGGKKKKVVEQDPNALTEVDKTFYELTITDLNRKLARLRSLTQELEDKNEELTQNMNKIDEDKSDIIIYLKRTLQEKSDEIAELEERIAAMQETRQIETEQYEAKIAEMDAEYKQMHEQLTSENKLLEGKLNSLEEFRSQRDDLLKKYEEQENAMEEQEKRHKRQLYDIEKKFIISKDKLKRDMEDRLLQLSTDFQNATEIRIAATTHRVIRENIAVNNELDDILTTNQRLYDENNKLRKQEKTLKQNAHLHESEKNKALQKSQVQLKVIERLTSKCESFEKDLIKYKDVEHELAENTTKYELLEAKIKEMDYITRILEQNLHACRCDRTLISTELLYLKEENKRLSHILFSAVQTIKDALSMRKDSDVSFRVSKRESLLSTLLELMSKADEKMLQPSLESVDVVNATYERGDLGFVPKPVVLRSQLISKRNIESQTGTSLDEFIEDRDEESNELPYEASAYLLREEASKSATNAEEHGEEEASILFFNEEPDEEVDEEEVPEDTDDTEELLGTEDEKATSVPTSSPETV